MFWKVGDDAPAGVLPPAVHRVRRGPGGGVVSAHSWSHGAVGGAELLDDGLAVGASFVVQTSGLGTEIVAIRDGLLTDDDEVVAHALAHAGPHLLWLTRPSPTPRGVVVCDLVASLAESLRTAPAAAADDAALLLEDLLGLDADEAASQRLRAWSHGPHPALWSPPPESGLEVVTVVRADRCGAGVLRLLPDRSEWYPHGFGIQALPQEPDADVAALLGRVVADLAAC